MRRKKRTAEILGNRALQRVEKDRRSVPRSLGPIFDDILKYLAEPSLDAEDLAASYSGSREELVERFERRLKCPLISYLRARRLDLAAELIETTTFPIWKVAARSGFDSERAFRRAFKKRHGVPPEEARRRKSKGGVRQRPRIGSKNAREWRRLIQGGLTPIQARQWLRRLHELIECRTPSNKGMRDEPVSEETLASLIWLILREIPRSERRSAAATWATNFKTAALHECLLQQSRLEARREPKRGVWIAELAIEILKPLNERLEPQEHTRLMARGLAWLANSLRRSGDLQRARQELGKAKLLIKPAGAAVELFAEIACFECHLLIFERRLEEALEVADRAIIAMTELDDPSLHAQTLLAHGAAARCSGLIDKAIGSFKAAASRLSETEEHYLKFVAHQNLTVAYLRAGQLDDAAHAIDKVKHLSTKVEPPPPPSHIQWADAAIAHQLRDWPRAESSYTAAREGFEKSEDLGHLAVVSLDLSMLYTELSRSDEARRILEETLPILKALRLTPDTLAALRLLHEAMQQRDVSLEILKQVRNQLANWCNSSPT